MALLAVPDLTTVPAITSGSLQPTFKARMNEGGVASTKVMVVVSPGGAPVRCEAVFKNGPISNGEALCGLIRQHTHYSPAMDADGRPIFGVAYEWSQWRNAQWLGANVPEWDPVDLVFEVEKMPDGVGEMSTFRLALLVDGSGNVRHCRILDAPVSDQLVAILCRQAGSGLVTPTMDGNGKPVVAVGPYRVRLASKAFMVGMINRVRGR